MFAAFASDTAFCMFLWPKLAKKTFVLRCCLTLIINISMQ